MALVDDDLFNEVSKYSWHSNSEGYASRTVNYIDDKSGKRRTKTIKMHRQLMNFPVGKEVDHIDGNRSNNTIANLRVCSRSENMRNQCVEKKTKSGLKGVWCSKIKNGFSWTAQIKLYGKYHRLGTFATMEEAATAYNKAAVCLHGEFARIHTIKELSR